MRACVCTGEEDGAADAGAAGEEEEGEGLVRVAVEGPAGGGPAMVRFCCNGIAIIFQLNFNYWRSGPPAPA
jgi:hypothetical protein